MPRHSDLPDDLDSLKRLVREQQALLLSRDLEIEQLKLQLAKLRRMQFGRSSEQLDAQIAQLELTLEELEASEAALPIATVATPRTEPAKPVRRPLSDRHRADYLPTALPIGPQTARAACDALGPKVPNQLLLQYASRLDEQATVDRLVGHTHALVGGKLGLQPP